MSHKVKFGFHMTNGPQDVPTPGIGTVRNKSGFSTTPNIIWQVFGFWCSVFGKKKPNTEPNCSVRCSVKNRTEQWIRSYTSINICDPNKSNRLSHLLYTLAEYFKQPVHDRIYTHLLGAISQIFSSFKNDQLQNPILTTPSKYQFLLIFSGTSNPIAKPTAPF